MTLTYTQQKDVAELLAALFNDNEYLYHVNKINRETVRYAEDVIVMFRFCNKASAGLLAGIQCIPKSKNIYGWLLSCLPAVHKVVKANREIFYSNFMCDIAIQSHRNALKGTMIR
ncbi:MAG: hypothetical protein OEZ43_11495 [Gammaproteobacteria bacterium]|nr:hypothetical protein [Gammaproteobacteria bacterium]